ncbi:MAG: SUMF1/EgtB/PvdO family nonheme iron enzyme [bacterium]
MSTDRVRLWRVAALTGAFAVVVFTLSCRRLLDNPADPAAPSHGDHSWRPVVGAELRGSIGDTLLFSGAFDGDTANVAEYAWDFDGDGVRDFRSAAAAAANHAFSSRGEYEARFYVRGVVGDEDSAFLAVRITDESPSGSIGRDTTVAPGETLVVTPSISDDGRIASIEWDLDGDGAFETREAAAGAISLTYAEEGEVVLSLRAVDEDGRASTFVRGVRVCATAAEPVPVWPPDGTIDLPARFAVAWQAAGGCAAPVTDEFYLDNSPAATTRRLGRTTIPVYQHPEAFEHGATYWWRVVRTDAGGRVTSSPAYSFRVRSVPEGMAYMPAGSAFIGSNVLSDERPAHAAYVDAFYIDTREVTRAQYAAFVLASGYITEGDFRGDYPPETADFPAADITWNDANAYASWLGKRLPTEAEWEAAARNFVTPRFPWGNAIPLPRGFCDFANWTSEFAGACADGPAAVGSHSRGDTPAGISDMAGNVAEWVADWYDPSYYATDDSRILPRGPISGSSRGVRGGSWRATPEACTTSRRAAQDPAVASDEIGFRCASGIDALGTGRRD